ncbi:methyltransferase domain-containing protein [Nanoarchaeota archaeon]
MDVVKKTVEAFDKDVEAYYENTKNVEPVEVELRDYYLSLIPKGGRILDVACGPGRDCKYFIEKGFEVVGIDLSEKMVEFARKLVPEAEFYVIDFRDMPDLGKFDAVHFNAALPFIPKSEALPVLKHFHGILKPGGVIRISAKNGTEEGMVLDERYGTEKFMAFYLEDELKALVEDAGFEILKFLFLGLKGGYNIHDWMNVFCKQR